MFTKEDLTRFKKFHSSGVEMRGIWHMPNTLLKDGYDEGTLEGVQKLLDKVKEAGYNTILIETVNAYTVYPSKYTITRPDFDFDNDQYGPEYKNDYLACFIGEAHKRDIDVHAWTTTMRAGRFNETLSKSIPKSIKPEWLARGYHNEYGLDGKYGELLWLDGSNPEVVEYLINQYVELTTNYDLDGIELDAIRYPISNIMKVNTAEELSDFGYTDIALSDFKQKFNYEGDFKEEVAVNKELKLKWVQYRCDIITDIVEKLKDAVLDIKPDMLFSAAVLVHPDEAIAIACQDWRLWIEKDWFDFVSPMAYYTELKDVKTSFVETEEMTKDKLFNLHGIAAIIVEGGDYLDHFKQMDYLNEVGGLGSILFSIRQFIRDEKTFEAVKQVYQENPAISPLKPLNDILDFLFKHTKEEVFAELKDTDYEEVLAKLEIIKGKVNEALVKDLSKTIKIKLARGKK